MAQRVKELMPEALVVVGGHDASRDPQWFHRRGIDIVAVGDGEEVMPLLTRLALLELAGSRCRVDCETQ